MCSETRGVARQSWWIAAQSSSFSHTSRGSPGPGKRAKRVPPVPTPQEGTATSKLRGRGQALDVEPAPRELLPEVSEVRLEFSPPPGVVLLDLLARDAEGLGHPAQHSCAHANGQRVGGWTVPPAIRTVRRFFAVSLGRGHSPRGARLNLDRH